MKLNFITFMVQDIEKSVTFYRELAGLQVVRKLSPPRGEIVFMADTQGDTMLEFIAFANTETVAAKGMAVCFTAEGALEDLRSKAIALGYHPSEIIAQGPKPKFFSVKDPDGIVVEFGG